MIFRGLRARLLSLVAVALIPLAAFSVAGIVVLADAKRQDFDSSMKEIVRALSSAMDNELQRSLAVAQTLAASPLLERGDIGSFYRYCQIVLSQQPSWSSVALTTPDGEYVFNTARPLGAPLPPRVGAPQEVREVSRSGQPVIGTISVGSLTGERQFSVRAPVPVQGKTRYVLSVGVRPASLQAVLQRQSIPDEATVAVLDRSRHIVARSRRQEEFLGSPATPSLQRIMAGRLEGDGTPETLDGRNTYAAFSTSPDTGWSVVIGLPLDRVGASQKYAYLVLTVGLALSIALAAAAAMWLSRGIVRPVERLRQSARDIGAGAQVQASPSGFAELAEVSEALAAASLTLRESGELRATLLQREQEARLAAERASAEKDEFLAMLSHELRNPLAAITNAVELLRRLPVDSQRRAPVLQVVQRQLDHLRHLVDDLLDVSRVVTGKIALSTRQADLAECVRQTLRELDEAGVIHSHAVRAELSGAWAMLDVHRIQQVTTNLLTNAVRYSPQGSAITVSVRTEGAWSVLEVRDEGIGMDEATRARIFNLFYQGAVSTHRAEGGLGVGLTLVKRLVELHEGTIEAHSAGPNQGSRFVVRLPALAMAPDQATAAPQLAHAHQARGRRVLVVDDNKDQAQTLAELLRMHGFDTALAHDGDEALAVAAQWQPDTVLLDIGLPKQDGYAVCRSLRQSASGERLQIIALTGWGQESDRRKSQEAGFDAHLTKPVKYDELVASLGAAPGSASNA